jgi:hypothetical protein
MNGWRTNVRCYVSPAGNNKIADWYHGLHPAEQADTDTFLRIMRLTVDWSLPNYRPRLQGYKGLGELRWDSMGRKHRLIGFFMRSNWYALVGCTHKQQVYDPHDALKTAKRYKGQIERAEVGTVDYDL